MSNKPTIATLFSGGGVCLARLKDSFEVAWGVEYSPELAEIYKANISPNIIVSRVQDVDFKKLDRVKVLQSSNVCKQYSAAKPNGKEGEEEISQAQATCDAITILQPEIFILENVRGYMGSYACQMIVMTLLKCGYMLDMKVLNSANFGVPQTRERLILRASKGQPIPYLPDATAWKGWYESIVDLIPTLEESQFAEWQLSRLPEFTHKSFVADRILGSYSTYMSTKTGNEPIWTIRATDYKDTFKAFLVGDQHSHDGSKVITRAENEQAYTIDTRGDGKNKAWLKTGKVVKLSTRALARFQSLPDTYQLPDKASLACTAIGNGWPSLMAKTIIEQLVA